MSSAYREAAPKPIEPLDVKAERQKEKKPPMKLHDKLLIASPICLMIAFAGFNVNAIASMHHEVVAGNGFAVGLLSGIAFLVTGIAGLIGKYGP